MPEIPILDPDVSYRATKSISIVGMGREVIPACLFVFWLVCSSLRLLCLLCDLPGSGLGLVVVYL